MKLASPFTIDFDVEIVAGTLPPGMYDVQLAYLGYDHDSIWEYTLGLPSPIKKVHLKGYYGIILNLQEKCNKDAIAIGVIINNELRLVYPPEDKVIAILSNKSRIASISCEHGSRVPYTEPRNLDYFYAKLSDL